MEDTKEIKNILDEKLWNNDKNIIDIIMEYKKMFEEEDERIRIKELYDMETRWIECWRNH